MVVRYGNISERVRDYLDNKIEILHLQYPKSFDKRFLSYFDRLEENDEKTYKQLLGLFVSDAYKLLKVKEVDGFASKEEKYLLDLYEGFDNESAVSYLKVNPDEFISCFYCTSEFNTYDFFMKRSILNDSKDKIKYLTNLSCYSVYDFLYYCQKYELETLKLLFDDYINEGYKEDTSIYRLVDTVNELYVYDKENYKDIMIDLLTKYYLIGKNDLFKGNKYNFIPYMEQHDVMDILNYLNDDMMMHDILKSYVSYDGEFSGLKLGKNDQKTLQKIKEIREI